MIDTTTDAAVDEALAMVDLDRPLVGSPLTRRPRLRRLPDRFARYWPLLSVIRAESHRQPDGWARLGRRALARGAGIAESTVPELIADLVWARVLDTGQPGTSHRGAALRLAHPERWRGVPWRDSFDRDLRRARIGRELPAEPPGTESRPPIPNYGARQPPERAPKDESTARADEGSARRSDDADDHYGARQPPERAPKCEDYGARQPPERAPKLATNGASYALPLGTTYPLSKARERERGQSQPLTPTPAPATADAVRTLCIAVANHCRVPTVYGGPEDRCRDDLIAGDPGRLGPLLEALARCPTRKVPETVAWLDHHWQDPPALNGNGNGNGYHRPGPTHAERAEFAELADRLARATADGDEQLAEVLRQDLTGWETRLAASMAPPVAVGAEGDR